MSVDVISNTSKPDAQVAQSEALSALVDGEVTELELHRLLKTVDAGGCASEINVGLNGDSVKQKWQRYQLMGAAIRDDLADVRYTDLSSSISAAIASEPELSVSDLSSSRRSSNKIVALWSTLGRVAIAASVAGAVVIGVQSYQSPLVGNGTGKSVLVVKDSLSAPSGLPIGYGAPASMQGTAVQAAYVQPTQARQVNFVPRQEKSIQKTSQYNAELQAYLNHLMMEHAEHAALNGSRGMMPFARVAELNTQERFDSQSDAERD